MATEKVTFLYDNKVDDAVTSASSEAGTLGAVNLQNRKLLKVARTSGVTGEWWKAAFSALTSVSTVAIWNHNLSTAATVRVRLSNNADMSSPVYDVTHNAWPEIYGWDEIGWDLDGFGGVPLLTEFNDYKYYSIFRLGQTYEALYLRLDVDDSGNSDGYLQAGRLIAGVGWQPSNNFSRGWTLEWVDRSKQVDMEDGGIWVDKADKHRRLTLPFQFSNEADALGNYNDMQRVVGHSIDLLVLPFPDSTDINQYRTAIYGMAIPGGLKPTKSENSAHYSFSTIIQELTA